jgi:DHA1 family bicyclomycin/chloramphenicol resistance-like MFS transporter
MIGFSLMAGNFGAMAMENMGAVAGMASSLQGSLSSLAAAVIGAIIGRSFDGTTVPLYTGYLTCGVVALIIVYVTERGQFFVAHHARPALAGD